MLRVKRFVAFRAKLEDDSRLGSSTAAARYSFKMLAHFIAPRAQTLITQVELRMLRVKRFVAFRAKLEDDSRLGSSTAAARYSSSTCSTASTSGT